MFVPFNNLREKQTFLFSSKVTFTETIFKANREKEDGTLGCLTKGQGRRSCRKLHEGRTMSDLIRDEMNLKHIITKNR